MIQMKKHEEFIADAASVSSAGLTLGSLKLQKAKKGKAAVDRSVSSQSDCE